MKSVALTANGRPVQTVGHTPYEFVYTPAYEHIGDHVVLAATITDSAGQTSVVSTELDVPAITTSTPGTVGGTVPATLALTLGAPAAFGAFTPGLAKDYTRRDDGQRDLDRGRRGAERRRPERDRDRPPRQRRVRAPAGPAGRARNAANTGTAFGAVGGAPLNLLTSAAPMSNDAVTLELQAADRRHRRAAHRARTARP